MNIVLKFTKNAQVIFLFLNSLGFSVKVFFDHNSAIIQMICICLSSLRVALFSTLSMTSGNYPVGASECLCNPVPDCSPVLGIVR